MEYLEKDLTSFLNNSTTNPFLLYPFIKHIMLKTATTSSPLILVIKKDEEIIGFAPLALKQSFGFRRFGSLLKYTGSPDIVVKEEYRREVLQNVITILLERMHGKSIILTLPAESQNLISLEHECRLNRITYSKSVEQNMNHCIIPVNCSGTDFQKSLSPKHRKRLRQTERQLTSIGEWKIKSVETSNDDQNASEILDKIHAVEKKSWKENWRQQTGIKQDDDLEGIWETSRILTKTNPNFKAMVWVLELENEPVAYSLVLYYKSNAIIAKTSYASNLSKLSLGVYINNVVLTDLFNGRDVEKIDFLTALPFLKIWHPDVVPRVKFKIVAGALPIFFYYIGKSRIGKKVSRIFPFVIS
jgi:hypothetical protein